MALILAVRRGGVGSFLSFGFLPLCFAGKVVTKLSKCFFDGMNWTLLVLEFLFSLFLHNFISLIKQHFKSSFGNINGMSFFSPDLFEALSELIILTASHCLHGKEIRSQLNEKVAQLYADLDGGFSHAAWLLPGWLPLPSFRYG